MSILFYTKSRGFSLCHGPCKVCWHIYSALVLTSARPAFSMFPIKELRRKAKWLIASGPPLIKCISGSQELDLTLESCLDLIRGLQPVLLRFKVEVYR